MSVMNRVNEKHLSEKLIRFSFEQIAIKTEI